MRKSKLRYLPTGYTHYHPLGATVIDHIYTNCNKVSMHGLINDTVSDHIPVYVVKKQQPQIHTMKTITGRSYKNYSTDGVQTYMRGLDWSTVTESMSPSVAYEELEGKIKEHLDNTCPIKTFRVPDVKYPIFNRAVLTMIKKRKRNLRKARRIQPGIYNIFTARARRLMKKINDTVAGNRRKILLENLERYRSDPKKFWSIVNTLWKGDKPETRISLIDEAGNEIAEPEIANYINRYYSSIGTTLAAAFDNNPPTLQPTPFRYTTACQVEVGKMH